MSDELELLDSKNQTIEELSDEDDLDAVKEKYRKLSESQKDVFGKNRQLFERTKKAEGELKELKVKAEESSSKVKTEKSDEALLKRLDDLALKTSGISEADEVELVEKWKTDTGREADAIIDNSIFKKELEELRTAKANLKATSDIKGEGGEVSAARSTPEYWIAKATKGPDGKLLFPEETPKELYAKITAKMGEKEPGHSNKLQFHNQ